MRVVIKPQGAKAGGRIPTKSQKSPMTGGPSRPDAIENEQRPAGRAG